MVQGRITCIMNTKGCNILNTCSNISKKDYCTPKKGITALYISSIMTFDVLIAVSISTMVFFKVHFIQTTATWTNRFA